MHERQLESTANAACLSTTPFRSTRKVVLALPIASAVSRQWVMSAIFVVQDRRSKDRMHLQRQYLQ